MDPTVSVPVGWLASLGRWLLPPIVEFGSAVQRARNRDESFPHIPIWVHPRLGQRIGPATIPVCRAFLDLYNGEVLANSLPLCWSDMQNAEPPQDEIALRRHRSFLLPVAWRSEAEPECEGYFADARFVRNEQTRLNAIVDKSRFKIRVVSGSKAWVSPHFYLARCPEIGASNGLFGVDIEYAGEGTRTVLQDVRGQQRATAARLKLVFDPDDERCVLRAPNSAGEVSTRYFIGVRNGTNDRTIRLVSLRALDSPFTREVIAVAQGLISPYTGRPEQRDPVLRQWPRIDPGVTEFVELFGLGDSLKVKDERIGVLSAVQRFTLEAHASDTKLETATFEYDPATLLIRQIK